MARERQPKHHRLDLDTLDQFGGVDPQGRTYATAECSWCRSRVRVVTRRTTQDLGYICVEQENAWRAKSQMIRALRKGAFSVDDLIEIVSNMLIYGHKPFTPGR